MASLDSNLEFETPKSIPEALDGLGKLVDLSEEDLLNWIPVLRRYPQCEVTFTDRSRGTGQSFSVVGIQEDTRVISLVIYKEDEAWEVIKKHTQLPSYLSKKDVGLRNIPLGEVFRDNFDKNDAGIYYEVVAHLKNGDEAEEGAAGTTMVVEVALDPETKSFRRVSNPYIKNTSNNMKIVERIHGAPNMRRLDFDSGEIEDWGQLELGRLYVHHNTRDHKSHLQQEKLFVNNQSPSNGENSGLVVSAPIQEGDPVRLGERWFERLNGDSPVAHGTDYHYTREATDTDIIRQICWLMNSQGVNIDMIQKMFEGEERIREEERARVLRIIDDLKEMVS